MVVNQGDGLKDDSGSVLLKSDGWTVRRWLSIFPFVLLATTTIGCGTHQS